MPNYIFMFPSISKVIIRNFSVPHTKLSLNVIRRRARTRHGQGLFERPVGFVLGSDWVSIFRTG